MNVAIELLAKTVKFGAVAIWWFLLLWWQLATWAWAKASHQRAMRRAQRPLKAPKGYKPPEVMVDPHRAAAVVRFCITGLHQSTDAATLATSISAARSEGSTWNTAAGDLLWFLHEAVKGTDDPLLGIWCHDVVDAFRKQKVEF